MSSTIRRSGRARQANRKYQNDILEKETLRLLRESSESSRPTSPDTSDPEEVRSDDEFDTTKIDEAAVSIDGEDDLSLISNNHGELSEGSQIQTPNQSDENVSIASSGISGPGDYEHRPRGPARRGFQRLSAESHSRGLRPANKSASKETIWENLAGPSEQDILALMLARGQWSSRRDITFPSRKSLAETASQGLYGDVSRFGVLVDDLRREATLGWNWYDEESGCRFRRRQRLVEIDNVKAKKHVASTTKQFSRIVMGPEDSQKAYCLARLDAMDFGTAWEKEPASPKEPESNTTTSIPNPETNGDEAPSWTHQNVLSRYREGWLLNLGSKIQCLAWAPNRHGNDTQYLAISTTCSSAQRASVPASNDRRAPAFRPSPPYPSSIQLWAFRCAPAASEGLQGLDMSITPKLVQVLCTDWGNIRQLHWCAVLREPQNLPDGQINQPDKTYLGLLGVLSSDGHARVIDVSIPKPADTRPQYLSIRCAAFDASHSSSIYTCISFVSPTDLLCGTASGLVDLFNILEESSVSGGQSSPPPAPYLTTQQSLTYMLTLSPAYPSPIPNLLASTSVSGNPVLADLRFPHTDKVIGKTTRFASKLLAYSAHLRSHLSTSEGDEVHAYPLRRFFHSIRVARFVGQGTLTAFATSRWHPCLLMGTSGGLVSCTNILRRVLPSTKRPGGAGAWVQKLCEYHWIPETPATQEQSSEMTNLNLSSENGDGIPTDPDINKNRRNPPTSSTNNNKNPTPTPNSTSTSTTSKPATTTSRFFHGPDTRPGTSRFHDGFKAEKQDLSSARVAKARRGTSAATATTATATAATAATTAAASLTTKGTEIIFEEEQAVTAAEWNPNLECSGWVAVGWGSGILRVEDVGHDAV